MIHIPPLTRILISSLIVWRRKFCVSLKCLLHHVTSTLAAGGSHDKWQMNTHFGYHPYLCCHYLFLYRRKNHFHSRFRSQSITWLKNAGGEHSCTTITQQATYFSASLWLAFSTNEGGLLKWRFFTVGDKCHSACLVFSPPTRHFHFQIILFNRFFKI